jgi:hypothetical protein
LLIGCDRKPVSLIPVAPRTDTGPSYEAELQPLTPLARGRLTHIAVDSLGNVYWVQESGARDDTLFVMGEARIPRTAALTAARIADALGARGGSGNIQSIAPARGGDLYFYFRGSAGRRTISCFGIYSAKTERIRILNDTNSLMERTGLGRSLGLARGSVMSNGTSVWLWIRHTDDSALYRMRHVDIPAEGTLVLEDFRLNVAIEGARINLTDAGYVLAPFGEDSLFWFDPPDSMLQQIDAAGRVTPVRSLVGLPVSLSMPVRDAEGRVLLLAADSAMIEPQNISQIDAKRIRVVASYPAVLMFEKDAVRIIGRDAIAIYSGFPLRAIRVPELIPDPRAGGWVCYDSMSGELLRLRIHRRDEAEK